MLSRLRGHYAKILTPLARVLLRCGISPNTVTVVGSLGVIGAALWFFPQGHLVWGSITVAVLLLGDGLDGTMARLSGQQSAFGGFLDSTLDRAADGAIFCGLTLWALRQGNMLLCSLSLFSLVAGFLVSYARARAEAEGWHASVGLMERTERLVLTLTATGVLGLSGSEVIAAGILGFVAVASVCTAVQRIAAAARESRQHGERRSD